MKISSSNFIPRSTYRLQLNASFQFDDATAILPCLKELGISHLYLSPILKSSANSPHGYDVCDCQEIDPKLGGFPAFERFAQKLSDEGMGLLFDIVPNHMRADASNAWWSDVLKRGNRSPYARYFDFQWPAKRGSGPTPVNRVLVPILEGPYGSVLESGKLKIVYEQNALWIAYYEHRFPVSPETYDRFSSGLKMPISGRRSNVAPPGLEKTKHIQSLTERLRQINGEAGKPESFDTLDEVLKSQNYRLCWWKIANEEINYRRFFLVNHLVCLNAQKTSVFESSHKLIRSLLRRNIPIGLRVDHPDGLWDPEQYLRRLNGLFRQSSTSPFIVVEKILTEHEPLEERWPVAGTTGYDFLNQLNGIFVKTDHEAEFSRIYKQFTGCDQDFAQILFERRSKVLQNGFVVALQSLAQRLGELAAQTRHAKDFTFPALKNALVNFICAFPVYRTYLAPPPRRPTQQDKEAVQRAICECRLKIPQVCEQELDFISQLLLQNYPRDFDARARRQAVEFAMKLQQLTAPLAAKGGEDNAFYVYNRLVSLNEVGCSPGVFGESVEAFHHANQNRSLKWPHSLLATSTHDTKRSEDVRARINVLSEMPNEWAGAFRQWSELNKSAKTNIGSTMAPSPNDEWLLYQTLLGSWPIEKSPEMPLFVDRIINYMQKAVREADTNTNWIEPNHEYESALANFIKQILLQNQNSPFLASFVKFQQKIAFFGLFNSLSQILIKITAPGVPDLYQGTELLDLSLVDPDNRRPIDYEERKQRFLALNKAFFSLPRGQFIQRLLDNSIDPGEIKFFITWQALQARKEREQLFTHGEYFPLQASGTAQNHLCAFLRRHEGALSISVATRFLYTLLGGREIIPNDKSIWANTQLTWSGARAGQKFRDRFSNTVLTVIDIENRPSLSAGEVLAALPVALLESID